MFFFSTLTVRGFVRLKDSGYFLIIQVEGHDSEKTTWITRKNSDHFMSSFCFYFI